MPAACRLRLRRSGNLISATDAMGRATRYSYDAAATWRAWTEPAGAVTAYA